MDANTIQTTRDYKKFKLLGANREVNKEHVQRLINSYEKNPELITSRPLLVNDKFEVIDGQHRLAALKALNLPVHYMTLDGLGTAAAQQLNATQRSWSLKDYAHSYAQSGNRHYQRFLELQEETPVGYTPLMWFTTGGQTSGLAARFRLGEFEMAKDEELVEERLEMLRDYATYVRFWREYQFVSAVFNFITDEKYDHTRMMAKLPQVKPMTRHNNYTEYLRELENIFNYREQIQNQVRFF